MSLANRRYEMLMEVEEILSSGRSICARELKEIADQTGVPLSYESATLSLSRGRLKKALGTDLATKKYKKAYVAWRADLPPELVDFSRSIQTIDDANKRRRIA